jgi:hypothetical protein
MAAGTVQAQLDLDPLYSADAVANAGQVYQASHGKNTVAKKNLAEFYFSVCHAFIY